MKVAILSLYSRIGDVTGDCVQANKTAAALRELGVDALRCYLRPEDEGVYDSHGEKIGSWTEVMSDMDVIHAMVVSKFLRKLPQVRAKFVCYTVFWKSIVCTLISIRNSHRISLADIKEIIRIVLFWLGFRSYGFFSRYDLLLPNSEAELRLVKKMCWTKKGARFATVPNAIDELPPFCEKLERSKLVPAGDYVLVPAYFAPRKNQEGLLRAIKGLDMPFVFMGTGPTLDRCKKIAPKNCSFLGHIEHGSPEFWSIMKYARVVCLPSNCETPGIAALEAAALGARPVLPYEGGTTQYFGWDGEYHNPVSLPSLREAVDRAWARGRLTEVEQTRYRANTWRRVGERLLVIYRDLLASNQGSRELRGAQ